MQRMDASTEQTATAPCRREGVDLGGTIGEDGGIFLGIEAGWQEWVGRVQSSSGRTTKEKPPRVEEPLT